jgi:predicted ArsR family transcriptional regulator
MSAFQPKPKPLDDPLDICRLTTMARPSHASKQTRAVLDAFMRRPQDWRYGYDLARETGLKSGTLYPLLIRLDDHGLLEAEWREPAVRGRPARHAYRLTQAGIAFARSAAAPATPAAGRTSPAGALA